MTNARSKEPEKATTSNATTTTQKHSNPFYISPALFQNKRLKRKRRQWALSMHRKINHRQRRSENLNYLRKQMYSQLRANVTIDLLSDDDNHMGNTIMPPLTPIQPQPPNNSLPQLTAIPMLQFNPSIPFSNLPYQTAAMEISQVPSITLIPVPRPSANRRDSQQVKRKRKSRLPKRHAQPTIVNNESIVLSDDEENGADAGISELQINEINQLDVQNKPAISVVPTHTLIQTSSPEAPTVVPLSLLNSAVVDEEVTVSLVPRASTSDGKPTTNGTLVMGDPFPMQPDETTVHTVIANRIYELSLTKLREGLASCGHSELGDGQKPTSSRRKGNMIPQPATPPPPPVSLKLSSDLSISLISDDEDDSQSKRNLMSPTKLLRLQPQLSVQQLHVSAAPTPNSHQAPKRRKLG